MYVKADLMVAVKSIHQDENGDSPTIFDVEKGEDEKILPLPTRSAEKNQALYLKKYGFKINLPSMYVLDS